MTSYRFHAFTQPRTSGPGLVVDRSDIVGIEEANFDDAGQSWRARLHLRGGSHLDVGDYFEDVRRWYTTTSPSGEVDKLRRELSDLRSNVHAAMVPTR